MLPRALASKPAAAAAAALHHAPRLTRTRAASTTPTPALAAARAALTAAGGDGSVTLDLTTRAPVAVLTLRNPRRANALSCRMMAELASAVDALEGWRDGSAVVVAGEGATFCAGADLSAGGAFFTQAMGAAMTDVMSDVTRRLSAQPLVSVAAVAGAAVGGGAELATACDFRVLSHDATVQWVHTSRGLTPGWGGLARLSAIVGRRNALFIAGAGAALNAEQAATFMLADAVGGGDGQPATAAAEVPIRADWGGSSWTPGSSAAAATADPAPPPPTVVDHAVAFLAPFLADGRSPEALRALKAALGATGDEGGIPARERAAFLGLWGGDAHLQAAARFTRK